MAGQTKIFVPRDFEITDAFSAQAARYLLHKSADYLWIQNPWEPYTAWNCASLYQNGSICMGKYRIIIGRQIFKTEQTAAYQGAFACRDAFFVCDKIVLDLAAKNGTLTFSFSGSGDVLKQLDAGLRYLMPLEETDGQAGERGYLAKLYNPVFSLPQKAVFSAHLSPCEITDYEESYITMPKILLDSNFLTPFGEQMQCIPGEGAALVFERTASSLAGAQQEAVLSGFDFYLGIKGAFQCMQNGFVPGLSAGEYFSVHTGIRFQPGQNAFLTQAVTAADSRQGYPSGTDAGADAAVLEEQEQVRASTAWVQVQGEYYLSSAGSSFYTWQNGGFRPMALLAAEPDAGSGCFPVMPWLHAQLDAAEEGRRAEALLYAKRRHILTELPVKRKLQSGAQKEQEQIAVTPGGICIGISDNGRIWNWVGLGNVSGGERPDIRLSGELGLARQKFLNEECFLVITSAKELEALGGADGISILADGWRISLPKEKWEEKGVLAVLKYNQTCSIAQKLADYPVFTELMERAYKDGTEADGFHEFLQAVTDREFEGLVLFNAEAAAQGLPAAAQEIVSGIADLRAVYTAVNSSKITAEDGKIHIGASAAAAFICCQESRTAAQSVMIEGTCFKTTGLSVQISASKMVSFLSRSELFLQKLLGETAGCCLVLNGTLEQDSSGNTGCQFYLDAKVCCSISASAVQSIQIETVHMTVEQGAKLFTLGGRIAFAAQAEGDLFSYDSLFFENLCIFMEGEKITEYCADMRFLEADSAVRKYSLSETFGASVEQYYADMQEEPDSLGYCSVNTPVSQSELEKGWNGIVYSIPVWSGQNAGSGAQPGLRMLLAWSGTSYYFGVTKTSLDVITLSGVLGLGFGGIELLKADEGFMFRFCSIGVRLLNVTIPQDSADLYVFGKAGKTGWYMGYGEEDI